MATSLPKLSAAEIKRQLKKLPGWKRSKSAIVREFVRKDFTSATKFIAKLAKPANAMDHHPDVELYQYKRVKISLSTHSAGGLTQNDFDLAGKINHLA